MADLNMQIGLRKSQGILRYRADASYTAVSLVQGMKVQTLDLAPSPSAISTSSLSTLGICFAQSLSTVATVTMSFGRLVGTNLISMCTLKAGEAALLRLHAGEYAAKADVAGSRMLLTIMES